MLYLIWFHFIGDFILQTDKMAINKATSVKWLTIHSVCYGLPFTYFSFNFAIIIMMSHFTVDFFTSKLNRHLNANGHIHWFFTSIGFDQAIHLTILYVVYLRLVTERVQVLAAIVK
jgi:hypothetical protein